MSLLQQYHKAMRDTGGIYRCIRIEQTEGLLGYSPELVSVGLKAIDEGKDVDAEIAAYMEAAA